MADKNETTVESTARKPVRDGVDPLERESESASDKARSAARTAAGKTRDGLHDARDRAADAYARASDRAGGAVVSARDAASDARDRITDALEGNPIAAVLGGIALGIVVGALLPRTRRESELYGAIGARLSDAARDAASAARDAGRERLGEMGLSREEAGESIRGVIDAALSAATARSTTKA